MELCYPDPKIRQELYWKERRVNDPGDLEGFEFRPVSLEVGGKEIFEHDSNGSWSKVGLLVSCNQDSLCILPGLRTLPLGSPKGRELKPVGRTRYGVGDGEIELGLLLMDGVRLLRVCGLFSPFIVTAKQALSPSEKDLLQEVGDLRMESHGISLWLPFSRPEVRLQAQEFPDTVAVVTREAGKSGEVISSIGVMPFYHQRVGELMERCGRAHLQKTGRIKISGRKLPIREFYNKPTAWLNFCQLNDAKSWELSVCEKVSANTLERSRLLSFTLAREVERVPRTRGIKRIGQNQARLIMLDQGGATGQVVRTEPKRWKPRGAGSIMANELRYLTEITTNRGTYKMRSEAVADFRSDKWRRKDQFRLNQLLFAGERPALEKGEIALFCFNIGQPEVIRTTTGTRMQVVAEPRTQSIDVYITHLEQKNGDLYVDGFRSIGSFTAIPLDQVNPTYLIRGGTLRWRPLKITHRFLEQNSKFPVVFKDEKHTINVAITKKPSTHLIAPKSANGCWERTKI